MARPYTVGSTGALRAGLKAIHIGQKVWLIGKEKRIKGTRVSHQVIYAPDGKEHHLYGDVIDGVSGCVNRAGNRADEAKVKIFILTSILDDHKKWCFNLSDAPPLGKLKVIYSNGTVKNINFDGEFNELSLSDRLLPEKPIGYRING
jgi:hypothetical protein